MRYLDQAISKFNYSRSNPLAQKVNIDEYLHEIHKLSRPEFEELYISRPITLAPRLEEELTAYITGLTISDLQSDNFERLENDEIAQKYYDGSTSVLKRTGKTMSIVAPKGSGKTTFLHHYLEVDVAKLSSTQKKWNFVTPIFDFKERVTVGAIHDELAVKNEIANFLDRFLLDYLYPGSLKGKELFYKNVYLVDLMVFSDVLLKYGLSADICEFGSSEYRDQVQCIEKYKCENPFDYISRKYDHYLNAFPEMWIIVGIDNIDHHIPENPDKIIAIFKQLNDIMNIDIIYALRDTSFLHLNSIVKHDAWGAGFVEVLEPINLSPIAAPRIKITLDRASGNLSTDERGLLKEIASQTLLPGLGSHKGPKYNFDLVWEWIGSLTNYNYRYSLELLGRAMKSYHLFDEEFEREKYRPARRFDSIKGGIHVKKMKTALINGLELFYSTENSGSPVVNLFDCSEANRDGMYIIKIKILQYLTRQSNFKLIDVYNNLSRILGKGYSRAVKSILFEMANKGLIILINDARVPLVLGEDRASITKFEDISLMSGYIGACGKFHLSELLCDDIYLDEMKYATDLEVESYDRVFLTVPETTTRQRKVSTRKFMQFIERIEKRYSGWSKNLQVKPDLITHSIIEYEKTKAYEEYFYSKKSSFD